MQKVEKLIISPHADDEVLGCGGILDAGSYVYYCGIDESMLPSDPNHRIAMPEKEVEIENVARYLGFSYECNKESKVNFFKEQEFIGNFEKLFNQLKPDSVYLPHPGYNQDHRTIYNAAFVALRPHDRNYFVPRVFVYEAVHDVIWDPQGYDPNFFVEIDIERKLAAYRLYVSQVRAFRSPDTLKSIAAIRGRMANVDYAEAFRVLRWVA